MSNSNEFSSSPATSGLTHPKDVFSLQNNISDHLNNFQTKYARYVRCQNNETAQFVDPSCDVNGDDSFSELSKAYENLYGAMDKLDNDYENQSKTGKEPSTHDDNKEELEDFYEKMKEVRKSLDDKLLYIQEQSNVRTAPAYTMLRSRTLINTILVIFLIYLVYVMIFDIY